MPRGRLGLLITGGSADGAAIDVVGELLIGRGASGAGGLGSDPELSRRHAMVRTDAATGLTIEDLGSRNGTYLNGALIEGVRAVRPGDEITVGASTLVAVATSATADPPPRGDGPPRVPPLTTHRLCLRVTLAPGAGTATLQLDAASDPITLSYRAGRWPLASPRAGEAGPRRPRGAASS